MASPNKGTTAQPAPFSFWPPSRGGCAGTAEASAPCAEGCHTQQTFLPRRSPSLAGPPQRTQILLTTRIHHSTAQPFLPPLRTPIVPPPLLLPLQLHRLLGHPFPRATACLQLEKRVPLAQSLSGAVSPRRNRVPPRPVFRSSSEPPDCLRCRNPKRRLRSCAGIKCAPAARRISVFERTKVGVGGRTTR